jgi:invasion protein IalB
MRRLFIISCCAAAVVGCAKPETKAPAAAQTPPPPPAISLTDVAGKWSVKGTNEARDTTLVTYELNATANTTGWTITFPNRKPIPMRVTAVAGDSVVIEAGPYPSVLRKGVQVSTNGVFRLQNGKMVGLTVAHYKVTTADSVRRIAMEGTRTP